MKEQIKKGDTIIYFEIDSLLPGGCDWLPEAVKGRVESQTTKTWFRVKTVKLRKELSQGLIVPLNNFKRTELEETLSQANVGDNVTQLLHVGKYEPNIQESGSGGPNRQRVSTFPTQLVDKTDEIRIHSRPTLLTEIQNREYYISVKCDGMSGTYLIDPESQNFLGKF